MRFIRPSTRMSTLYVFANVIEMHALVAGLTIFANAVMLASLVFCDHAKVFAAAIEPIEIQENRFMARRHLAHDLAVHVDGRGRIGLLTVADGIALVATAFAAIKPTEMRKTLVIFVIDHGDHALGELNLLHCKSSLMESAAFVGDMVDNSPGR